jgi:predicted nucleic acid-binding protein
VVYVLDACALLAFLNDEPGGTVIGDLLKKAADGECALSMSIINLLEVHYCNVRTLVSEKAAVILDGILAAPVRIISTVSGSVFREASRLKASYKCSLADAVGVATALDLSGQFVSADHHELEAVAQQEPVQFLWLPAHPKK